ncbi:glycosyltransferase family 1 protein [Plantibacter sp. T3]|uniref:rhamnosyltransferase WsaF family glycosyltransferase n=1 Tax=Plantibacter sp. T3 TaxID=2653161 RepID=UPI0012F01DBF|nr:glycosyltransferase family 1 protein [Plantibacter sp. T3]VXB50852.1 Glycosyltransferase family 1 protein [Plantibacter sp. T3]
MGMIGQGLRAIRGEGVRSTLWRAAHFADGRFNPMRRKPTDLYPSDAIAADWTVPRNFNAAEFPEGPYEVAWLISPPSRTSGGHQNAFRFMEFLERAGHRLTIYLYQASAQPAVDIPGIRAMMAASSAYPELQADLVRYDPTTGIAPGADVVVSSDWQTAYPAFRYEGPAKRFSFVQDFEPWFYPASSEYVLAENTYRFGFHGFSAGPWLARKVADEYGMSCDHFDYSVDKQHYSHVNDAPRTEILFYARPPTPRRGWEIGELALTEFHRLRPDITINLVGWDMSGYETGFPFVNRSAMDISELNAVYNRCAAGLVLSLTDMSLLPLEIMSSGVVPVVNDSPNTTGVLDSEHIEYVPLSPAAIARRLVDIVERPDAVEHAKRISASITAADWSDPGAQFVAQFERAMRTSI